MFPFENFLLNPKLKIPLDYGYYCREMLLNLTNNSYLKLKNVKLLAFVNQSLEFIDQNQGGFFFLNFLSNNFII